MNCCLFLLCFGTSSLYADDSGQELFEENCAACHGDDGVSILPGSPNFAKGERLEKSDDELLKSINDGLNVMPPWDGVLSTKQMKACLDYVRSLSTSASE